MTVSDPAIGTIKTINIGSNIAANTLTVDATGNDNINVKCWSCN
ncbi:MAG: hypothetical protein RCG15_05565 [Candidatus Rickettsia vulgarisii]